MMRARHVEICYRDDARSTCVQVNTDGEQQNGWLVQSSTFAVDSNGLCFLHKMGREALQIPKEGSSIVFDPESPENCEEDCSDAVSNDFSMNPVFDSLDIIAGTQDLESGTDWGILGRFSMYLRDDDVDNDIGR